MGVFFNYEPFGAVNSVNSENCNKVNLSTYK